MMNSPAAPIYHLTPAAFYDRQPADRPYLPETFAADGFIHCTAGIPLLLQIANAFFAGLQADLLALEIDPTRLTAPLKFEPPISPAQPAAIDVSPASDTLFPHIYGPLNRDAIVAVTTLTRSVTGRWQWTP
jgi:uncharacterized protein (DUF952 family)